MLKNVMIFLSKINWFSRNKIFKIKANKKGLLRYKDAGRWHFEKNLISHGAVVVKPSLSYLLIYNHTMPFDPPLLFHSALNLFTRP